MPPLLLYVRPQRLQTRASFPLVGPDGLFISIMCKYLKSGFPAGIVKRKDEKLDIKSNPEITFHK